MAMKRYTEKNELTREHKSFQTVAPLQGLAVKKLVTQNEFLPRRTEGGGCELKHSQASQQQGWDGWRLSQG